MTLTLERTDGYLARLRGASAEQHRVLYDALSFLEEDADRSPLFQNGSWDGRRRLYEWDGCFPAGLMRRVQGIMASHPAFAGQTQGRFMQLEPILKAEPDAVNIPLRDYQAEGVRAVLEARSAIGEVATGGGKTRMAIAALEAVLRPNPGTQALFIVTSTDIRQQTAVMIRELLGEDWVSELTESANLDLDGRILVATASLLTPPPTTKPKREPKETTAAFSLRKARWQQLVEDRTERWQKYQELIFSKVVALAADECHHVSSNSWYAICQACTQAYYRSGWTGTAFREDGSDLLLEAATGPITYVKTARELVEAGFLVRPSIYLIRTPIYGVRGETYRKVYDAGVINHAARNGLIQYVVRLCRQQGRHTLILVKEDAYGKVLQGLLSDLEIPYITGKTAGRKRERLLEEFRDKAFPALMATTLADEGLDVPAIDALALCGSGKSDVKITQRAGRTMRLYPGKQDALIFDFEDSHNRLLASHALQRANCLSSLGYSVYSWEAPVRIQAGWR